MKKNFNRFGRLALFFVGHRKPTVLIYVLLVILGIASYTTFLKREGFPPIDVPVSVVSGRYFADDPNQVDKQILQPLDRALREGDNYIDGITGVTTTAGDNFFNAFVEFDTDQSSESGTQLVKERLEQELELPDGASIDFQSVAASKVDGVNDILVTFYAPAPTELSTLQTNAQKFAALLEESPAISSAEVTELLADVPGTNNQAQVGFNRIGVVTEDELAFYPSIVIGISREGNIDDLALSDAVKDKMQEVLAQDEFSDFEATASADFAVSIRDQIGSLQNNLLAGLTIVTILALVLVTWRVGLLTAAFMIITLSITFLVLHLIGYSLNTISLFALVLIVGLFVDDATVVLEAIDARKRKYKDRLKVIGEALTNIGRASTIGTATTVLVFAPMAFITGILGDFIRIFPITVIVALIISLLVSLTLMPVLASSLLFSKKASKSKNTALTTLFRIPAKVEESVGGFLESRLELVSKKPKVGRPLAAAVIIVSLGLIIWGSSFGAKIGFDIFPPAKDGSTIQTQISFAPGLTINQAEAITDQVNDALDESIGSYITRTSYFSGDAQPAFAYIDLTPFEERDLTYLELIDKAEVAINKIEGASVQLSPISAGPPAAEFPFKVQVFSEDIKTLQAGAQAVVNFLDDRTVDPAGSSATTISEVKVAPPVLITRVDGKRYVEVSAKFAEQSNVSGYVAQAQTLIEDEFTEERLNALGLSVDAITTDSGQETENQESFASAGIAFLAAILIIFVLLVTQFKSIIQPLLILLAIPFSIPGVFPGLYLTDQSFSFFIMIGMTGLVGIVVNNTILLVDVANQKRRAGMTPADAMGHALHERLRPLLVTSLTTIFGLLPLALSDPFWEGLAFTIIFGLAASTLLVITAFPYYYITIEGLRNLFVRGLRKLFRRVST